MSELSKDTREVLADYAEDWGEKFRTTAMDDAMYEEFTKSDTSFAEYQDVQDRIYELSNSVALAEHEGEECLRVVRKLARRNRKLARQRVAVACLKMVEYGEDEGFVEPGVYYEHKAGFGRIKMSSQLRRRFGRPTSEDGLGVRRPTAFCQSVPNPSLWRLLSRMRANRQRKPFVGRHGTTIWRSTARISRLLR